MAFGTRVARSLHREALTPRAPTYGAPRTRIQSRPHSAWPVNRAAVMHGRARRRSNVSRAGGWRARPDGMTTTGTRRN